MNDLKFRALELAVKMNPNNTESAIFETAKRIVEYVDPPYRLKELHALQNEISGISCQINGAKSYISTEEFASLPESERLQLREDIVTFEKYKAYKERCLANYIKKNPQTN